MRSYVSTILTLGVASPTRSVVGRGNALGREICHYIPLQNEEHPPGFIVDNDILIDLIFLWR
jgi:hypothetical protein